MRRMIPVPDWIRFHPFIVTYYHRIARYIPFFLPHHKAYYGFRHLASSKHGLFVDVGANDGISALGFRQMNKTYRILSVEPNPSHEEALRSLKRRMKGFDYTMVGAGARTGQKTLYIPMTGGRPIDTLASLHSDVVKHTSRFYAHAQNITYIQQAVPIIPLDTLKLQPDIIKIDTEGHELEVLYGLIQTIRTCRPYLLIESTPKLLLGEEKFFRALSYALFAYNYRTDLFSPYGATGSSEKNQDTKHLDNIFCIPTEKIHLIPVS